LVSPSPSAMEASALAVICMRTSSEVVPQSNRS
jgi:hypothetical protein